MTDQSDARLVLLLSGPRVRDVLAKGVPVDLHPKAFKPGDVANTIVAHIGVQIDMLDDAPIYQLTAPRSTAGSFWSWLTASAAEFGYEVRWTALCFSASLKKPPTIFATSSGISTNGMCGPFGSTA